jgi:hypothetical protein
MGGIAVAIFVNNQPQLWWHMHGFIPQLVERGNPFLAILYHKDLDFSQNKYLIVIGWI